MIVILGVAKDRLQAGIVVRAELREQGWSGGTIVDLGTRDQDRHQQAQSVNQHVALATLDFLAPVVAPFFASHLGGFDRLTIDARSTRRGVPSRCLPYLLSYCRQHRGPGSIIPPLDEVVIDRALGQQIMG